MPHWDYRCPECLYEMESEGQGPECPRCLMLDPRIDDLRHYNIFPPKMERLPSAPAFHLKGAGWTPKGTH